MKKRLIFTSPYEFWKVDGGSSNRMFQMLYIYQNMQYFCEIFIYLDNGKKFLLDDKGILKSFTGKQNLSTDFLHINYLSSVEKFQKVKRKISIVDLHDDLTGRNNKTNSNWLNLSKEKTKEIISKLDLLIHISKTEFLKYQKISANNLILNYWPSKKKNCICPPLKQDFNHIIGFVGTNNPINGRILEILLKYEGIKTLKIGGNIATTLRGNLPDKIYLNPKINNLSLWYSEIDVQVLPIEFQTGFPTKIIETLLNGIPILVSSFIQELVNIPMTNEAINCVKKRNLSNFNRQNLSDLFEKQKLWIENYFKN